MGLWANRSIASIVRTMLDVTRLRVLVAVARHGSVTAAAHALNYAQPSVSHHLARLEAETGTKLVQRRGTPARRAGRRGDRPPRRGGERARGLLRAARRAAAAGRLPLRAQHDRAGR